MVGVLLAKLNIDEAPLARWSIVDLGRERIALTLKLLLLFQIVKFVRKPQEV